MITPEDVRGLLKQAGLNQGQLAERVGVSQPTVSRWLKGQMPDPAQEAALRDLMADVSEEGSIVSPQRRSHGFVEAPDAPEIDKGLYSRDVPIIGISSCGDGDDADFSLNGQTGDYARRPPGLIGKRNVYAINVFGESMWPAHKHGALLYVDPKREPGVGEDAVIEMKPDSPHGEPGKGFLKRVKRLAGSKIECEQFNPPEPRIFHRSEIKSFHRVIPWEEVLGY